MTKNNQNKISIPRTPSQIFWYHFRRNKIAMTGGIILAVLYFCALFAGFFAPYSMERQNRNNFYNSPTSIHFFDEEGNFHLRPFVYRYYLSDTVWTLYSEDKSQKYPIKFFVKGDEYKLFGFVKSNTHFFGVDEPGLIFLFGSDLYGRDVFSRILYGSQISLSVGLVGITITFIIGMIVGGISGFYSGTKIPFIRLDVDDVIMRTTELIMSMPGLYLILALRATFPVSMSSDIMYLMIVAILSFIGWASLSRVIRGMVLSIRENDYVQAAKALGFSNFRIILKHILPNTMSYVIVAATIAVPAYILGEVALSFLGVGIMEPQASWGNMLQQAQSVRVLKSFKWILTPGFFIFITVLAFNFLGDGLRDALDPKKVK